MQPCLSYTYYDLILVLCKVNHFINLVIKETVLSRAKAISLSPLSLCVILSSRICSQRKMYGDRHYGAIMCCEWQRPFGMKTLE